MSEALLSFFHAWKVLGLAFSALTKGLVLLRCPSVGRSWEEACIQWAQLWASVCMLNFLAFKNERNMLARQKCCCHQTAGLGIPVEVAACLCCLGIPVSLETLFALLCQPCQECLMCPVPCAVGCARMGPPDSSGNVILLKAHLSPFGWAGTCSAASWGPSVPCLCHHCCSMPPACLAPRHQLLSAAPALGGH